MHQASHASVPNSRLNMFKTSQCFMTVYDLIWHVHHRDKQLFIYLLPALHHTHGTLFLHNDPHWQWPPAPCAVSRGALTANAIKASEGSGRRRELYDTTPAASSCLAPSHVSQAKRENAAAQNVGEMEVRQEQWEGFDMVFILCAHSWVGREETLSDRLIFSPLPLPGRETGCGLC